MAQIREETRFSRGPVARKQLGEAGVTAVLAQGPRSLTFLPRACHPSPRTQRDFQKLLHKHGDTDFEARPALGSQGSTSSPRRQRHLQQTSAHALSQGPHKHTQLQRHHRPLPTIPGLPRLMFPLTDEAADAQELRIGESRVCLSSLSSWRVWGHVCACSLPGTVLGPPGHSP